MWLDSITCDYKIKNEKNENSFIIYTYIKYNNYNQISIKFSGNLPQIPIILPLIDDQIFHQCNTQLHFHKLLLMFQLFIKLSCYHNSLLLLIFIFLWLIFWFSFFVSLFIDNIYIYYLKNNLIKFKLIFTNVIWFLWFICILLYYFLIKIFFSIINKNLYINFFNLLN